MSPEQPNLPHESWWHTWGKPMAYLLLGVVGVAAAAVLALFLAGVIFR